MKGSIEVIVGSMFSGKTEELIRRVRRARIANLSVAVFKSAIDTRYAKEEAITHDGIGVSVIPVSRAGDMYAYVEGVDVVGIDEAQFFDEELADVCDAFADRGVRVIVSGLDTDYRGRAFSAMKELLCRAEKVDKVYAVCTQCGSDAVRNYRKGTSEETVLLGEKDAYEALCRNCFNARRLESKYVEENDMKESKELRN
jgi:thymidine kinase